FFKSMLIIFYFISTCINKISYKKFQYIYIYICMYVCMYNSQFITISSSFKQLNTHSSII
ncbi:MAG: hypothetical protein NW900_02460, partial [Candidatus Blochmannia sp. A2]|nr:hypothetical protein [Candidatus Blochmannia sp. A2]